MRATATAGLYVERSSPVHALAPHVKVVAALAVVFAVVCTPRSAVWAFAFHAGIVAALVAIARVPPGVFARRLLIELPFLAFAVALPFVARGPDVVVAGLSLSRSGLWDAWNIVAKGTLGAAVAVLLVSSTRVPDLLAGMHRLRVPRLIVAVAGFTVRYGDVLADDLRRARIARVSRGYDPRWFWQARAVATGAGTMFVRAYERGERVHLAMLARGYDTEQPLFVTRSATRRELVAVAVGGVTPWMVAGSALAAS